jgi:hypothetical protein
MRPSTTFLDSAGRFSTFSRRNFQKPILIKVSMITTVLPQSRFEPGSKEPSSDSYGGGVAY